MSGKIKVKFVNGNEDNFDFEPQGEPTMLGKKLRELLDSNALVLQLEGAIEIIPFANIQSITVIPSRENITEKMVLQGAVQAAQAGQADQSGRPPGAGPIE